MAGRMTALPSGERMGAYLSQVHHLAAAGAPLLAMLIVKAPTQSDSTVMHASLRNLLSDMQRHGEGLRQAMEEACDRSPALPATLQLGRFLAGLADAGFHAGVAGVAGVLRAAWVAPGTLQGDLPEDELARRIAASRESVPFGMAVHTLTSIMGATPPGERAEAAAAYRGALERFKAFWDGCWEVVRQPGTIG